MPSTVKSDQLTKIEASPAEQVPARDADGRVRHMTWTVTPGAVDAGSTIRFGSLPKGARILGGRITAPICGASSATLSVGIAGTTAKYLALTPVDAALSADVANTDALFRGQVLAADTEIIGTTAAAALLADKQITLTMFYSRD